jgi:tetratricopeptide (TPR) repeat protein
LGRPDEALRALDRYLDTVRSQRRAEAAIYRARAQARSLTGDHAGAAEDYTRALGLEPEQAVLHAGRGWSYLVLEAPGLALRDFERTIALAPKNGDAYNGRGYALARIGKPREAARDAETALRLDPDQPRTLYNAARVFSQAAHKLEADLAEQNPRGRRESEKYQERALGLLREALALMPQDRRAAFWKSTVERDAALVPLRRSAGFRQLAAAHAGPAEGTSP